MNQPSGAWREGEQFANRAARASPRSQLQHLAEQHEGNNYHGRLEVHWRMPMLLESSRYGAGENRCEAAVQEGRPNPEHDEREHVRVNPNDRLPAAED